ncbi:hypothetical protein ACQY0O_004085 [Thecaphora frezii]
MPVPDKYLSGEASYNSVKQGQKNGLMACAKHGIGYELETSRNDYQTGTWFKQDPVSTKVDGRTTREL